MHQHWMLFTIAIMIWPSGHSVYSILSLHLPTYVAENNIMTVSTDY